MSARNILALVLIAACHRQPPAPKAEWKPYTGDRFTIEFPGPTVENRISFDAENDQTGTLNMIQSRLGDDQYWAGYADVDGETLARIGSNIYDHVADAVLNSARMERTGGSFATLNGVRGHQVYGTSKERNDMPMQVQIFVVGNRVYAVSATTRVDPKTMERASDAGTAQHFFQSLHWNS